MNSYSATQKLLHKLSLAADLPREASFDLEHLIFSSDIHGFSKGLENQHVFVAGLARSGTTILLRAIHESHEFASLSYADMPFVLAPNLWSKLRPQEKRKTPKKERAHGDGILVSTDSPEAFEEVFWKTFLEREAEEKFPLYISSILKKYNKKRYLSKNNQNVRRIETLCKLYPSSNILIPFRDPLQHCNSLLTQHLRFCALQAEDGFIKNYMDWIGHSEFGLSYRPIMRAGITRPDFNGLDHWLEQWYLVYSQLFKDFSHTQSVNFVCYEDLCSNPQVWERLKLMINIEQPYGFAFKRAEKSIDFNWEPGLHKKCQDLYDVLQNA